MLRYVTMSCVLISPVNVQWGLGPAIVEGDATDFWYDTTARALRCGQCASDHCPVETKSHLQGSNLIMHSTSNFLLMYSDIPYDLMWSL